MNGNQVGRIRVETQTYVSELEEAEFAEIGNGAVSRLDGDDELDEGHLLGAHQIHRGQVVQELLHFLSENFPVLRCAIWI